MTAPISQTIPDGLPPIPEPPAGHRWVYRGKDWDSEKPVFYGCARPGEGDWGKLFLSEFQTSPGGGYHYIEAVPVETQEPDYSDPGYREEVETAHRQIGKRIQFRLKDSEPQAWHDGTPDFRWGTLDYRVHPDDENSLGFFSPEYQSEVRLKWAKDVALPRDLYGPQGKVWNPIDSRNWIEGNFYRERIKPPEPKRVPLEFEDLPATFWVIYGPGQNPHMQTWHLVVGANHKEIIISDASQSSGLKAIPYKDLMLWSYSEDRKTWRECSKEAK